MTSDNKCPLGSKYYDKSQKCCPDIDYDIMEEVFPAFWEANIKRDYSCFDFDKAFDLLKGHFYEKLVTHGINGLGDCTEYWNEFMAGVNGNAFKDFAIDNPYISISKEELYEAMLEYICRKYRQTFEDDEIFKELKETYDKIIFPPQDEREKAILMDNIIDSVHHTRGMWED